LSVFDLYLKLQMLERDFPRYRWSRMSCTSFLLHCNRAVMFDLVGAF
jgi:hypothetical protein